MTTQPPKIILKDKAETLAWLAAHDESFSDKFAVRSDWLCDELDRFALEGFVYNSAAQKRIMEENGIDDSGAIRLAGDGKPRSEGGLLGVLIYNAQGYRAVRALESAGWIRWGTAPASLLSSLAGKTVNAIANGELGGEIKAVVKTLGERLRLCPPRTRTKAYADYLDWWIKPIDSQP